MSKNFSVDVTVLANYNNKSNILKILEKGNKLGFIYHDHHIGGGFYSETPIMKPAQAYEKILHAIDFGEDGGPTIYVGLGGENYTFLSFYRNEGMLVISMFGMGPKIEREFEGGEYALDFAVYIRIMLDLCNDFALKKIELGEY